MYNLAPSYTAEVLMLVLESTDTVSFELGQLSWAAVSGRLNLSHADTKTGVFPNGDFLI
jgi:hypothetical protein